MPESFRRHCGSLAHPRRVCLADEADSRANCIFIRGPPPVNYFRPATPPPITLTLIPYVASHRKLHLTLNRICTLTPTEAAP